MKLTRRQQEIYAYLRDNAEAFDHPPSYDELCRVLGLSSRGSLHKHIQALIQAGLVEPMDRSHRGIRLTQTQEAEEGIPFLGTIAAGRPIEAVPQPEYLQVPEALTGSKPCYVLKVRGDSMIDAGIFDGDYVVVRRQSTANNGQLVAALVSDEEATVKRFRRTDGRVMLEAENPAYAPMVFTEGVEILGIVVAVLRRVE